MHLMRAVTARLSMHQTGTTVTGRTRTAHQGQRELARQLALHGRTIFTVRRQLDVHQANPKKENSVADSTLQMSVSGTATGKPKPAKKLMAMQTGTIAIGTHLKVTHAATGRPLMISCTAESTLMINGRIGATIETLLELSINATGTTRDALIWAKTNHGTTVSGMKTVLYQRKHDQNSQKIMELGSRIFNVRSLLDHNPVLRHNNRCVQLTTIPSMHTGNATGKTVIVELLLETQTGTRAIGTSSALTNPLSLMVSMGILSASRRTQSKIAAILIPMAHITTAIGSTLAVKP